MSVTVTPEAFTYVFFDNGEISAIAQKIITESGLPADTEVTVNVDETTPLGRAVLESIDPVVIKVESGAFEDAKKPRHLSPVGTADVLGRLLFRVRDRKDPAFGEPPADADLTLAQHVSWDAYAMGRMQRLGHDSQRQRRLYHFRNRHGFTDAADEAFTALWDGDGLTWADITRLSDGALNTQPA